MEEIIKVLSKLLAPIEQIASAPDYSWLAPLAVLLSGSLSFWAAHRVMNNQQRQKTKNQDEKKRLLFKLLRDETDKRWKQYLKLLLPNPEPINPDPKNQSDLLKRLNDFSKPVLQPSDVFVFRSVSESFSEYHFLKNDELVSKIIHCYLVYRDIIDVQTRARRSLSEYDQKKLDLRRLEKGDEWVQEELYSKFASELHTVWDRYVTKIKELDKAFANVVIQLPECEQEIG